MSTRSLMIHPSAPAVLLAPATVISRLTVPCDSDILYVSLIRDGLASQQARSPTVLNTVSLVRSSAA